MAAGRGRRAARATSGCPPREDRAGPGARPSHLCPRCAEDAEGGVCLEALAGLHLAGHVPGAPVDGHVQLRLPEKAVVGSCREHNAGSQPLGRGKGGPLHRWRASARASVGLAVRAPGQQRGSRARGGRAVGGGADRCSRDSAARGGPRAGTGACAPLREGLPARPLSQSQKARVGAGTPSPVSQRTASWEGQGTFAKRSTEACLGPARPPGLSGCWPRVSRLGDMSVSVGARRACVAGFSQCPAWMPTSRA